MMDYGDDFDNDYESDPVGSSSGFRKGKGRAWYKTLPFTNVVKL